MDSKYGTRLRSPVQTKDPGEGVTRKGSTSDSDLTKEGVWEGRRCVIVVGNEVVTEGMGEDYSEEGVGGNSRVITIHIAHKLSHTHTYKLR